LSELALANVKGVVNVDYSKVYEYVEKYINMIEQFILTSSKLMLELNQKIDRVMELIGGEDDDSTATVGSTEQNNAEDDGNSKGV
jgi:hypothetical protein